MPSPNAPSQARDITWPTLMARCSLTVTSQLATLTDPPALGRESPHHGLGSPGLLRQPPGVPQLTLTTAPTRPRPGGRPLATIPTPGGGRRRLGLPPRRGRLRGIFRAATSLPRARCRGDRAAHPPGPSRRWGASHHYSLHLSYFFS